MPIQVVKQVNGFLGDDLDPAVLATIDMITIGFFFLCRPGEHTKNPTNTPFHAEDVILYRNGTVLPWHNIPVVELNTATAASLTFTTQKNGVKGEVITHGTTGDPNCCPVRALVRRLTYIKQTGLPLTTPLCSYRDATDNTLRHVTSKAVSMLLKASISQLARAGELLNISESEVDARSLRAGGATALLCARVDREDIQLFGRWKSDAMLRYLHIAYNPVIHQFAREMYHHGTLASVPASLSADGRVPASASPDTAT